MLSLFASESNTGSATCSPSANRVAICARKYRQSSEVARRDRAIKAAEIWVRCAAAIGKPGKRLAAAACARAFVLSGAKTPAASYPGHARGVMHVQGNHAAPR